LKLEPSSAVRLKSDNDIGLSKTVENSFFLEVISIDRSFEQLVMTEIIKKKAKIFMIIFSFEFITTLNLPDIKKSDYT
jgi:hypothetical protein